MHDKNETTGNDCEFCKMTEEVVGSLSSTNTNSHSSNAGSNGANKKSFKKSTLIISILVVVIGGAIIYGLFSKPSDGFIEANFNDDILIEDSRGENQLYNNISFVSEFTTTDLSGQKVSLSDFRDKIPVLLVFWATWCSFCQEELEDLNNFTLKYQDAIKVFAIPSAETKDTLKKYLEEKNIEFTLLLDETRDIWNQYLVRGTPSHFLVNKKGKILTVFPGIATADNLETMFNMLVD